MGLAEFLARRAVRVAHVLVVETPGSSATRMLAERALTRHGWSLALSPAEADVLFVCGAAGERLRSALDHVWEQMPGPRARVSAVTPADLDNALDTAANVLFDDRGQRDDARDRPVGPPGLDEQRSDEDAQHDGGTGHGSSESEGSERDDPAHEQMDHEHMGHGDMEMAPGGIALAEGAEDEDGLSLDALAVPLGPVLAHWPAGLVLHLTLHGDRIVDAEAEWLAPHVGGDREGDDERSGLAWRAAHHCDDTARLLVTAGWESAADEARRQRDALLSSAPSPVQTGALDRLADRVDRNRTLRWALRGLTVPDAHGTEVDLVTRPASWLRDARRTLVGDLSPTQPQAAPVDDVAERVVGLDIASARMVVAGCAPLLRRGDRDRV